MRRAGKIEPIVIDDVFVGFVLGGDHCAEHEYGIDGINWLLGIPASDTALLGIDKRKAKAPVSPQVLLLESASLTETKYDSKEKVKKDLRVLCVARRLDPDLSPKQNAKEIAKRHATYSHGHDLYGAWDSHEFALMSTDPKMCGFIDTLAQAIRDGDIAAWTGRFDQNPFSPGGLAIAIPSRIPAEQLVAMRDADVDRRTLLDAAASTGIEQRLEQAGLRWYALSPKWAAGEQAERTIHKVVFWLNPQAQSKNNCGWFTVEDLDQWIAGEGPVPKEKAKPAMAM